QPRFAACPLCPLADVRIADQVSVALEDVRGLHALWAGMTGNGPRSPLSIGRRIMLDALGLGLGETMSRFAHQPDWPTFSAWILENAGPPDPVAIARYHAWLDGTPPPQEVTDLFAAIEAMPDALDAEEIAHW